ncbi:hypothetical protein X943_000324 [Babesia divergens]|uniref:Uncharacterized protein n=1 Tax=Babesia divergens TaxID=32595 RepID=A0AAD9LG61_BABDI|nr:hypothetical protein X943_000324 [Babesia divergens]
MGSNSLERTLQGGQWKDQNVNGSGRSGQNLKNWLTDEKTLKPLTPGLIRRGFLGRQLKDSNDGSMVATVIAKIIKHDNPEALQKALSYLLFSCPWDNALLGHALCFVTKFCSEVGNPDEGQKNFKGYSEELKTVCQEIEGSLTSFVQGSGQSHILAVSQGSNVYSGVFNDDSLDDYCDWLRGNLKNIIQSLKAMDQDCKNWSSPISFEWGFTAGPFLYGFVPKTTGWMTHIESKLPKAITPLIESLEKLEKALEPSSSAGATAGGVFTGLFGLGGAGAGAAYATNAFGFQNFITSLISGFLK